MILTLALIVGVGSTIGYGIWLATKLGVINPGSRQPRRDSRRDPVATASRTRRVGS